ncbi:MAG: SprB repeat-containing protein, partial [Chitinophagaceae bacterium]
MLIFTRVGEACRSSQFSHLLFRKTPVVPAMTRMMFVLLMGLFIQTSPAQAQVPVEPCPNCVSEDIKLIEVTFKDYDPASCPKAGTPINEDSLRISFYVTSKYRYGFLFVANLYVDGDYKGILYNCYPQTFEQGYREVFLRLPDSLYGKFNAGTKIEVRNVFTAWDNNKPSGKNAGNYRVCNAYNYATNTYDCKMMQDGNSLTPKCKYYPQAFRIKAPAKPEITFDSSKNVTCYGGSNGAIYISVAPTTQDYTYTWTKGGTTYGTQEDLTGAPAGTFTVTVNAQGCTSTLEKEITQPEEFKATTKTINTTCYDSKDGKAIVVASGGTAPYTYSWATSPTAQTGDTATGLARGSYSVTITDANGCQITRS